VSVVDAPAGDSHERSGHAVGKLAERHCELAPFLDLLSSRRSAIL